MSKITEKQLEEILKKHKLWLNNEEGGERANLSFADLSNADLCSANLSYVKNLTSPIDYIKAHFERTPDGYVAYKTFNGSYFAPIRWEIKVGSVIDEVVNQNRTTICGSGINVAPLKWVEQNYPDKPIWKVLIRWEWLPGVCVPYNTDGKIRCERVELVEVVK